MNSLVSSEYPLLFLLVGALLLLLGRRLFWLFIAAAGFITGIELTRLLFPHQPELLGVAIAVLLGLLGAVLAIFVQKSSNTPPPRSVSKKKATASSS